MRPAPILEDYGRQLVRGPATANSNRKNGGGNGQPVSAIRPVEPAESPPKPTTPPKDTDDAERLELRYGLTLFGVLDSDDIEELSAQGVVWIPPAAHDRAAGPGDPLPGV